MRVRKTWPRGRSLKCILLGSVIATVQYGIASAQQPDSAVDAANLADEVRRENVVVVTATKRERSLQDVPISVTALSADTLDNAGVTNLESLQFSVPGLSMITGSGAGFSSSIRIRGVGTSGTNIGFEGSVGIFVDGTYRPRAGTSLADFADVERIEVLRGPQGTLFGRNTTAGAISIVTKKPVQNEHSASLRTTFGNYNSTQVRGIVNAPLLEDKLAARLAADYSKRDGFLENVVDGGDDINDRDRITLRGQLLYEPNPDMEFRLIGNYFSADESCCGSVTFTTGGTIAAANAGLLSGFGIDPLVQADGSQREDFLTGRDQPTYSDQEEYGVQADFEWDLGGGISFFNSMSYSDYELNGVSDADQTGINFTYASPLQVTQKQFTEEFRFSGTLENLSIADSVHWLLGGYYSDEKLGQVYGLLFGEDADTINTLLSGVATGFPPLGFAAGDHQLADLDQDAQTYAVFGHIDADLTDRVNLSGGVRFTSEKKTGTGAFDTVNMGPLNPFILPGASDFEADADADEWIGTLALNYHWTDDVSTYASYAHGYKSGGVNLDVLGGQGGSDAGSARAWVAGNFAVASPDLAPAIIADPTFPVEEVDTYEIGFRSRLGDGNTTLNVTGFHSTFSNFQLLQFTGTSFNIVAAPEVISRGVESELQFSPIDGLDIGAQYTYAEAYYNDTFVLAGSDLDSLTIDSAPKHSAGIDATYSQSIPGTNFNGFINGGWFYNSAQNTSAGLEASRVQDAYSLLTGRIGIRTNDDKYGLELWCRNCTDQTVNQLIFASPVADDSEFATVHPPMEWGVTLSARF